MPTLGITDALLIHPGRDAATAQPGDVLIEDGIITALGPGVAAAADRRLAASGALCLPGFVQTHVHLCQTIMRGMADDLPLLPWLSERIWPLEAAHTPESLLASARLGIAELLLGGTTSVLAMETVHHTDVVFEAAETLGIRATIGKTHMDEPDAIAGLREDTQASVAEARRLARDWHGAADGRLRYAYSPRFALSCTRPLLERVAAVAKEEGVLLHTHASENQAEVAAVRARTGLGNIDYLDAVGLLTPRTVLAHGIHLDAGETKILADRGVHVAHCPTCNLKLGSGIADVPRLLGAGVNVTLGADGAPCNNALDMFQEMKLAAVLHNVRHGAGAVTAAAALHMATGAGARALDLGGASGKEPGSLAAGRPADLIVVDPRHSRARPRGATDPASWLVFAGAATDVRHVVVDGRTVVEDGALRSADLGLIHAEAEREAGALGRRAGV